MLYTIYRETDPCGRSQPCSRAKLLGYEDESSFNHTVTKQYWNIEIYGIADINVLINEVKHPIKIYHNVITICDKELS